MVDMSVPYRGPDGMSAQLLAEVQQRFGDRAQNLGFVTGYMDAARAGQTGGHFADAHGITHAVDIGVDVEADGTGLRPADALWLAEHLRQLGAAGAHPFARRGYLIHDLSTTTTPVPKIAGFHTGWRWVDYTGASPHSDHIHVTTGGDQQWGGPPQLDPAVYNSRQSWGIGGTMSGYCTTQDQADAEMAGWLVTAVGASMPNNWGNQCSAAMQSYTVTLFGRPWTETLGYGNAIDHLNNASPAYFHKIPNDPSDPNLLPRVGDIAVYRGASPLWDGRYYGHTGAVKSFTAFAQTLVQQDGAAEPSALFPDGYRYSVKPAHTQTFAYVGDPAVGDVLGWLRPRVEKIRYTGADTRGYGATRAVVNETIPPALKPLAESIKEMTVADFTAQLREALQDKDVQFYLGRAVADAFKRPDAKERVARAVLEYEGPVKGLGLQHAKVTNTLTQNAYGHDRAERTRREVVKVQQEQAAHRELLERIAATLTQEAR